MRLTTDKMLHRNFVGLGIILTSVIVLTSCQNPNPDPENNLYLGPASNTRDNEITQCPLRCLCFRTTVRCMFLNLDRIPSVGPETTILDLRFNRIREIPVNSFAHLPNLDTLLLNNNHIVRLQNGAFNGLRNLKFLYLYKNRIREIEQGVFKDLENLEQLYLHYNSIEDIGPATFSNLTNLERLFLHNNKIQKVPFGSFDHLNKMRRLRLDSNALICDCGMMGLAQMLADHPDMQSAAICQSPARMHGKPVSDLQDMELDCRKPTITEEPRDVEVNFGNTVSFTCRAEGDPTPNIVWLHNSNEIVPVNEPRYTVLNDGTLMIANAQDQDMGIYECMAKSTVGEAKSRRAKMEYKRAHNQVRPRFRQAPKDQEIPEGRTVVLACEATGSPPPVLSWTQNDSPLQITRRHQISSTGTLEIRNVVKSDEGIYRCIAANSLGRVATIAQIRIQMPPVWTVTPLEQSVRVGEMLILKCEATGKPAPVITWTHNGLAAPDPAADGRVVLMQEGNQLVIKTVIQEDDGEYGCRAQNAGGHIEAVANIRVIRGTPPVFTDNALEFPSEVSTGKQLRLACSATGTPQPYIIWRKNGHTLIESSRITILPSGTLIINRFHPAADSGAYECAAFNDHGVITSDSLRIDSRGVRVDIRRNVDDSVVIDAIAQARADVELAENVTLEVLFGNMSKTEIRSPFDLLRLARFPRAEARNLARSAEIYERALQIIAKHAEGGDMKFDLNGEYSYSDLLTPHQLDTLGRFSGCISHRKPKTNCSLEMCFHSRYRSIDGACNNLAEPMWGNSYTPFQRLLKPIYENGFNLPIGWTPGKLYNGFEKPLAREISSQIIRTEHVSPDSTYTHMLMQWGQFLDHDLDHALPSLSIESYGERISCRRTCLNVAPCFPMLAPEGDSRIRTRKCIEFTRSAAVCGSGITSILFDTIQHREQINQLTSFIDGSQVYGSSEQEIRSLQSKTERWQLRKGIYMSANKPLMPFATDETPIDCRRNFRESDVGCFLGGDIRVNEQVGLLAMHTVWFRQHNFIADKLKTLSASSEDEVIFQEARKIVGAQMQHITYAQWLPLVIGRRGIQELGPYRGYDPQVNPTITTEFATAALRFGHTLINPVLRRLDENFQSIREGDLPLRNAFFAPWRLVEEGGLDPIMRGLFHEAAKLKKPQELLNSHLTEDLFSHAHLIALDLAAMNIQRGRDHGLPSYNEYRALCNLTRATSFDDLSLEIPNQELRDKLEEVYKHVDNIDLWVGGVAEEPDDADARVGPTFRCILVDQFRRLRDGDRFWYENPSVFRPEQLVQIKQTSLARILCDTGDALSHVKRDVFLVDSELLGCSHIPSVQFEFWAADCCGGGGASTRLTPATCPILHKNTESNLIRRRREVRDSDSEHQNQLSEDMPINGSLALSKLDELVSIVQELQTRIHHLEEKCENEDKPEAKFNISSIASAIYNLFT